MRKLILFISKLTGSYAAGLSLVTNLVGTWPALLIGFAMLKPLLHIASTERIIYLVLFIVANSIILIFIAALVYGSFQKIPFRFFQPWWQYLRNINAVINGEDPVTLEEYFEKNYKNQDIQNYNDEDKESIYLDALDRGLRGVSDYPKIHTLTAMWAILFVVIPFFFFEAYITGSFQDSNIIIPVLLIGMVFFVTFIFISSEIATGPIRSKLKNILKPKINNHKYSLKFKFFIQIFIFILSLVSLFLLMSDKSVPFYQSAFFIVVLSVIAIFQIILYMKNIMNTLAELGLALKDLGEGGKGNLYLSSLDKEFVELGNDFTKSASEVVDYRGNLEAKVEEKTKELESANSNLMKKDELFQIELDLARDIQQGLLPKISNWNDLSFAHFYHPMEKVSGDYFDIFPLTGDNCCIVMTDVSGHGVPAALITTMGKLSFQSHSAQFSSPADILTRVNSDLNKNVKTQDYMTAFLLMFDKDYNIRFSNASHQKAVYLKNDNSIEELDTLGFFLGALDELVDVQFEVKSIHLNQGEKIFLFTDGITEMKNLADEEFGLQRLYDFVKKNSSLSIQELTDEFEKYFYDFVKSVPANDDISFLGIERSTNSTENSITHIMEEKTSKTEPYLKDLLKAKELFTQGEITEGFNIIENLNKQYPGDPQILFPLAKKESISGNYDKARVYLDKISAESIEKIRNINLKEKIIELQNKLN